MLDNPEAAVAARAVRSYDEGLLHPRSLRKLRNKRRQPHREIDNSTSTNRLFTKGQSRVDEMDLQNKSTHRHRAPLPVVVRCLRAISPKNDDGRHEPMVRDRPGSVLAKGAAQQKGKLLLCPLLALPKREDE